MKINPQVEADINQRFDINTDKKAIVNCVTRYAKPSGFCQTLGWMCFRVFEAIKSIFGYSEWQKTEKLIKNSVYTSEYNRQVHALNPEEHTVELDAPAVPFNRTLPSKKAIEITQTYAAAIAKATLNDYLRAQEKNSLLVHDTSSIAKKLMADLSAVPAAQSL